MPLPEGFDFSKDETKRGLKPSLMAVFSDTYDHTAYEASCLVEEGSEEALFVPAVRVAVDSALNLLNLPEVQTRLPLEVQDRMKIATYAAEYATKLAQQSNAFQVLYARNPDLSGFLSERVVRNLHEEEYLTSLAASPFFDVSVVAGGGVKKLQQEGINEDPATVIARSRRLLAVSGVYKGHARQASDFLGLPYMDPDHAEILEGPSGIELGFTDEAKAFLRSLHIDGRGCPAGKIEADSGDFTLLEDYWERIVAYLLPPGATVEGKSFIARLVDRIKEELDT